MNKVRDVARVTNAGKLPQYRKPKSHRKVQAHIVNSTKVDTRVWKEAMRIAKGDMSRIVVNSKTEVIVLNKSRKV